MIRQLLSLTLFIIIPVFAFTQTKTDTFYLLQPDRVFDGEQLHTGWQVLVKNNKIE